MVDDYNHLLHDISWSDYDDEYERSMEYYRRRWKKFQEDEYQELGWWPES